MYPIKLRILAVILLVSMLTAPLCLANGGGYQRRAMNASAGRHHWPGGGPGYGPGFGAGYLGGYTVPQIYGSWYQRPYPYHFDYFRWRYSQPHSQPPVAPNCPCEIEQPSSIVVQPEPLP